MPGRKYNSAEYRYGFNGKEKDDEGEFGSITNYDYGFRIYNPAIGRFLSVDPLTKGYPMLTPYQFASNSPIANIDLDGLERFWAADGSYLGKYGESLEMRVVSDGAIASQATSALSDPQAVDPTFFTKDLMDNSIEVYEATGENELSILRAWAKENRSTEREYVMSIFDKYIENDNGEGYFNVMAKGSTGKGEKYKFGEGITTVNPELSKGLEGWHRSTTIHTHPKGEWDEFSNEPSGFMSGGDIQWSIKNNTTLYLVPPYGNIMGAFDPEVYTESVIKAMEVVNERYKREDGSYPYSLDHPGKSNQNDTQGFLDYWDKPSYKGNKGKVKRATQRVIIDPEG